MSQPQFPLDPEQPSSSEFDTQSEEELRQNVPSSSDRHISVGGITLAAISSLTFTAPAYAQSAAPTDPDGAPPPSLEQREIPPNCVIADEIDGDTVIVINNCDTWQRVKVLVAFGPDSACKNIAPRGGSDEHTYLSFGRFDGLQRC